MLWITGTSKYQRQAVLTDANKSPIKKNKNKKRLGDQRTQRSADQTFSNQTEHEKYINN